MNKISTRNYGIDLLRVVALVGVIVLHVMGHGKILATSGSHLHFMLNWALEILAYPAVNCFVLVSGFVGYREEKPFPKAKNILSLWMTVLFYSVCIALILVALFPEQVSKQDLVRSFFPLLTDRYWFFTCYFGMFVFSPALNALVDALDRSVALWLGGIVIVLFSGSTLLNDPFALDGGYTVLWFLILYLLGAVLKKTRLTETISPCVSVLIAAGMYVVTCLCKWAQLWEENPVAVFIAQRNDRIVSYTSPTVLLTAIGTVCLFSRIRVGGVGQKLVSFFSSTAFSVYLIHDHPLFRRLIMKGRFAFLNEWYPIVTVVAAVGCAIGIFSVCALTDKVREALFRLCRVDRLAAWLSALPLKIRAEQRK